jgi:glycosyltransferase involved in cell wall biosynthesis
VTTSESGAPFVSVVIPTYNSAKYLGAAIDSVLMQSFHNVEVLVIDDGSTDDTDLVMSKYGPPVRLIRQPNQGVAVARNRGIEESRGSYVAFLDADDTWLPHKLECQLAELAQLATHRACYCADLVRTEDLEPLAVRRRAGKHATIEDLLLRGNVIGNSGVVCDRSLFAVVGDFDQNLSQCADWDMWIRIATITEFVYVDEPLVMYRQHGSNMSRDPALLERDSLRVLEKGFGLPCVSPFLQEQRAAAFARNYMVLAGTYFYARRYRDFARCAMRAVSLDSRQLGYLTEFPRRAIRRRLNGERPVGQWR